MSLPMSIAMTKSYEKIPPPQLNKFGHLKLSYRLAAVRGSRASLASVVRVLPLVKEFETYCSKIEEIPGNHFICLKIFRDR